MQIFRQKEYGTHGRKWYTDQTNNIAFSLALLQDYKVNKLEGLTLKIAEILVEVFKDLYGICLAIKSPNDLVYKGKKIGGILTQTKLEGEVVKYVVIGVRNKYKSRNVCKGNL